jgi:hypothetical protein
MASLTQAKGRVSLGTVVIKHLQSLVWWVCNHQQKQGLPLVAADFDAAMMSQAYTMKALRCELANKEPSVVANLGKVDPNDFDAREDAFLNLLAQEAYGVSLALCHSTRCTSSGGFSTNEERRMYPFPLT